MSAAKKSCVVIFIIDCSDEMQGSKIGTVNSAIEEFIPELSNISNDSMDGQILVKAMLFSTGSRWINKRPILAERYRWEYLDAQGKADMGSACLRLKKFFEEYFVHPEKFFSPVVYLLSNRKPTDNFKYGCFALRQNEIFQRAIKVAIAIGDDADVKVLKEFTGNVETVITVHTPEALRRWIRFIDL